MEKNAAIGTQTPRCCGGRCRSTKAAKTAEIAAVTPHSDLPGQQHLAFPESAAAADDIDGRDPVKIAAEVAAAGFR